MRILYCNKYNYPFSGTEAYLFQAMDLMRSQGHEVALFSMADPRGEATEFDRHFVPYIDFKSRTGLWQKIRGAAHAIYSPDARRRIGDMIREFRPDIAHVRNIYHHLSPSILWELKAHEIPVLYHLNDFKLLCPSYNLVARGNACEACKGGNFWHVLEAGCYPGTASRITLMAEAYLHQWLGTYKKCVDRFLAPSQFVRDKFVEHGWDVKKFEVLPHFQKIQTKTKPPEMQSPILYFGRLSSEKGVDDLLRVMQRLPHMHLNIAGSGPQRDELEGLASSLNLLNVTFIGHVHGPELRTLIAQSQFTVLPSHAYETLGKTILESYAEGRPVVASDLGSRRELVREGETGLLYPVGDLTRLSEAIEKLGSHPELTDKMGKAGLKFVQERHTPEAHYHTLLSLYQRMIATKRDAIPRQLIGTTQTPPWERSGTAPKRKVPDPLPITASNPKLRIAFIGGRGVISKYSGIESYYEEVGKRLVQMGHEVTIYCRDYFTPPLAEHNGMKLVRLPTIRSKHLETLVHTVLSTLHVLTQRCDIVHYHALGPALFSRLPRWLGKKTMVTVQGLDWQRKKWGKLASAVLQTGERAAVRLPNGTMVVSHALQQHFRGEYNAETYYVPNGGILRERCKANQIFDWNLEPDKYILFLGRFSPEKGCHLLIEAYEKLDADVKLVLAGGGSYCDDYSRELRMHAGDKIKILDWVSGETLDELLTNAMIFVLPSDLEGLSLALLDAMGAGLCVLTSDVPENREVVDEAGFTFRRGSSADLADRLRFLIANPSVREAAGKIAKTRIRQQYQWRRIAADIEAAYFEVMGLKRRPQVPAKKPSGRVVPDVLRDLVNRKIG